MSPARKTGSKKSTTKKSPEAEVPIQETMRENAEATGEVSEERAERFYDRMRSRIHEYLQAKGKAAHKTADFLLLVPDLFMLLWRLAQDARVSGKNKVLLGSGIAYYIFPFDIVPEALLGPVGYLDDLVFGVYMLNKMLTDTDVEVLREHWSGDEDVLDMIRRVLAAADNLVGTELIDRLKKMMK
jgi:uncharacterized membrane protein YkvA (DUF1232 family)